MVGERAAAQGDLREGVSRGEHRRQGKGRRKSSRRLEMENNVLYVDKCLLGHLLALRGQAVRVIAISDTAL